MEFKPSKEKAARNQLQTTGAGSGPLYDLPFVHDSGT
jgi:hypothetical protein